MHDYTAKELKAHLDTAEPAPLLLDVREPWEYELCHIQGSRLVPMGQIDSALDSLDADREIIVICHHGGRSQRVADYLERAGFTNIANLTGGIDAWTNDVDPSLAKY
ncbi:MAG TPA: rhodanese-like domain-containing protein [Gammaproteobacteria bacterium]|nr:rhodanese-like domain-containing protein [Gammaproteobacteria bacterium]